MRILHQAELGRCTRLHLQLQKAVWHADTQLCDTKKGPLGDLDDFLVVYAQTAASGIVLLTGSPVYNELSGRSCTSKFDRKVRLFFRVLSLLFDVKG